MNYELAKQLKDAGFPLDEWIEYKDGTREPRLPTLEELIEACGVAFSELIKMTHTTKDQRWVAISISCEECGIKEMTEEFGTTSSEAVAKLWLALNKKK